MKNSVIGVAIAMLLAFAFSCQPAFAQNTPNYMTSQGSDWEVGSGPGGQGVINIGANGKFEVQGTDKTAALASVLRESAGSGALSAGTLIASTGLTSVTSCSATLQESSAPGVSTSTITYTASGGTVTFYGWKPTSSGNPTLIATTGTETVGWRCAGT